MPGSVDPLLVIGAGPFGLAVAADARRHAVPCRVLGKPMDFWRRNMPAGMILRSAADWHLDPQGELTIEAFLADRGQRPSDVEPLPIEVYLEYAAWFQQRAGIDVEPAVVQRLAVGADGRFEAELADRTLYADNVVLATGLRSFARVPPELTDLLPPSRWVHTRDLVDFAALRGQRCLIVGGRQSAFEWAALIAEAGAASVEVVHRHPSPAFAVADWGWASELAERLASDPGWFRRLPDPEQQRITRRMWGEGRLKVEPWLAPRLAHAAVRIRPDRTVRAAVEQADGSVLVTLDSDEQLPVDLIVLATGYAPDLTSIPFLAAGNLLDRLAVHGGCPALDLGFQTSVPGLYATGALATADFGPFFGFTLAARFAAMVLGRAVRDRIASAADPASVG